LPFDRYVHTAWPDDTWPTDFRLVAYAGQC
jgi:hypothetical protein